MASSGASRRFELFVLDGSQFCTKVLTALDSRKIPCTLVKVSLRTATRRKQLPTQDDNTQVPVLRASSAEPDGDVELIQGSAAILQYFDDHGLAGDKYFPDDKVRRLDKHVSTVINAYVLYFNWIDEDGFRRSIGTAAQSAIPWPLNKIISASWFLGGPRGSFVPQVKEELGIAAAQDLPDRDEMVNRLTDELRKIQDENLANPEPYLFGCSTPNAADFSLFAMTNRLVGYGGDVRLPPSLPSLWQDPGLKRLEQWYQLMENENPIVYKRESSRKA